MAIPKGATSAPRPCSDFSSIYLALGERGAKPKSFHEVRCKQYGRPRTMFNMDSSMSMRLNIAPLSKLSCTSDTGVCLFGKDSSSGDREGKDTGRRSRTDSVHGQLIQTPKSRARQASLCSDCRYPLKIINGGGYIQGTHLWPDVLLVGRSENMYCVLDANNISLYQ